MTVHDADARPMVRGYPVHQKLLPLAAACFIGALLTDIAYAYSANIMWANFSDWLLAAGFILALITTIAVLIALLVSPWMRAQEAGWPYLLGNVAVLVLALFDNFIHSRDAWTSVVPTGLILSAVTVVMVLITGAFGVSLAYRARVWRAP